jgi:signal transduction histidine kinase
MNSVIRPTSGTVTNSVDLQHQKRVAFLGTLAAGIAHDNANTFNALLLKVELLRQKEVLQGSDLESIARQLKRAAQRAVQLTEFIKGDDDLNRFTAVDLRKSIEDAIELVEWREFENGGTHWTVDFELPDMPPVAGPPGEVMYLFVNLLMNACEAMPNGGAITVSGRTEDKAVIVTIADRGCGIPHQMLAKIFEDSVTTKNSGSGWGLYMARELMHRLGGSIAADNRTGGGAVFTLHFPLASPL